MEIKGIMDLKEVASRFNGESLEDLKKDAESLTAEFDNLIANIRLSGAAASAYGVLLLLIGETERAQKISEAGNHLVEAIALLEEAAEKPAPEPAPETAEDSPEEEGANVTE